MWTWDKITEFYEDMKNMPPSREHMRQLGIAMLAVLPDIEAYCNEYELHTYMSMGSLVLQQPSTKQSVAIYGNNPSDYSISPYRDGEAIETKTVPPEQILDTVSDYLHL